MSETTIRVPAEHVEAIRQSLDGQRGDAGQRKGGREPARPDRGRRVGDTQPRVLVGSRAVLWNAVYDSLCAAAEQLADDLNEYWRGAIDPEAARLRVAAVAAVSSCWSGSARPPAR